MNPPGRPTCFTKAKANRIIAAIRKGLPYKLAASAGGISYNTFVRWRNEGSSPDGSPHLREFCHQVRVAEFEAAQRFMALVEKAADKNWKAAAWMLEKRHPDLFGKSPEPPSKSWMDSDSFINDDD